MGFLALGQVLSQLLMASMEIAIHLSQIAGSLFLLFLGFQLTFGSPEGAFRQSPEAGRDVAIFPLALPAIASPGALTAVVALTDNDVFPVRQQLLTAFVVIAILALTWLLLLAAETVYKVPGVGGGRGDRPDPGPRPRVSGHGAAPRGQVNVGILKALHSAPA